MSRPVWALGMRPFYLLAAIFASLSVALWALQYAGLLPFSAIRGPTWHGHEMLFGFSVAVIAGFLLTAVRNWTGQPTATGPALAGLAALWLAGRVLVLTPFAWAAAVVNALFPAALAVAIAIPLVRAGNRRNYFFVALLAAMSLAVFALHAASLGAASWPPRVGLRAGLDIVLFIVAVIAGRVIPMFTNNGVPGADARREPWIEKVSMASLVLLLVADVADAPVALLAIVLAIAAAAHGARLYLWNSWRTRRNPLVWVLHAAYAWIPIHFVLRALALAGVVPEPLATHALTIGVIGGMTIGMMTRTARGHTGRPLGADRWEVSAYVLVQVAAVVRVLLPLAVPSAYVASVVVAASAWSLAYAVYAVRYWPILTRARLDGKPG